MENQPMGHSVHLVECPRDAMQGLSHLVPTALKVQYINKLIQCGFDTVDFGSFVSEKAIPQMRDTAEVLSQLQMNDNTKLLAIVANEKGANAAVQFDEIEYVGYPFSISETFQIRNTNSDLSRALTQVEKIHSLCAEHQKTMVVYLSMAFGNPYGEAWSPEIAFHWANRLASTGIKILALSDTIGCATPTSITNLFSNLIPALPSVTFGAHFHTRPDQWLSKMEAAYLSGCRRFDGALRGFGGCPMADDELVGNMDSKHIIEYFENIRVPINVDKNLLLEAEVIGNEIFI